MGPGVGRLLLRLLRGWLILPPLLLLLLLLVVVVVLQIVRVLLLLQVLPSHLLLPLLLLFLQTFFLFRVYFFLLYNCLSLLISVKLLNNLFWECHNLHITAFTFYFIVFSFSF